MALHLLFTTSRVVTAVYRIMSTSILLYYLAGRMRDGKKPRIRKLEPWERDEE